MEIKRLSCPLCLKPHFQGVESLRTSLISAATSHLACPVCSELLLGLDKLTIHLFTHIGEHINNDQAKNNEGEEIQSVKDLNESINSITKSSEENDQIKCDICSFTFTDRIILDMHQKLLHQTSPDKNTGLYSYHCHLCSKKFKKRGSLMVHLRVAHYGFAHQSSGTSTNSENLSNHTGGMDVKVQDNKQWECEVCSKLFTTKYFLKKHKRLHTGEMPYFCAQCNKSFTFQQSYHKHMLYHSSEKPYICNECGRAFKELSTLQNHGRIHSGEKPFQCETCGKRFRQRVSYLVHQRIHTGVMPYKCTACGKSFRYKVSQKSHKCPMIPPGVVIKVNEAETNTNKDTSTSTSEESNVKCIMSVDYNTGTINFIQSDSSNNVRFMYLEKDETGTKSPEKNMPTEASADNADHTNSSLAYVDDHPDLYTMVMSPLLTDVESLCLTSSIDIDNLQKPSESGFNSIQMANEESLKELLYVNENKDV